MTSRPAGSATQVERRRSRRYPLDLILEIEWGSSVIEARVRDLSNHGMLVEVEEPLWIGANFSARLRVNDPVALDCVVRRVEPGRGMGISYVTADSESQARILALLKKLAER